MEFGLFKQIVDECSQYGPRSFSLHLFGEPLLYPFIVEAFQYIKQKNKRNTILLTTNGTMLNKFTKEVSQLVDRVIWSYRKNNFNKESLQLLQKKGLIRLLIEETPKEEFEKWSKFPRVEIKHLHNYGGNIDVSHVQYDKQIPRYPCYHLWLAPAIRWNGDYTICCNDPNGLGVLGSVCDFPIKHYWDSVLQRKLRTEHLEGKYTGICSGCNSYQSYPDIFFEFQKKCAHEKN